MGGKKRETIASGPMGETYKYFTFTKKSKTNSK